MGKFHTKQGIENQYVIANNYQVERSGESLLYIAIASNLHLSGDSVLGGITFLELVATNPDESLSLFDLETPGINVPVRLVKRRIYVGRKGAEDSISIREHTGNLWPVQNTGEAYKGYALFNKHGIPVIEDSFSEGYRARIKRVLTLAGAPIDKDIMDFVLSPIDEQIQDKFYRFNLSI